MSCGGQQSLLSLDVTGDVQFSDVTLRIDANASVSKIFPHATFGPTTVLKAGMYLPSSVTGTVTIRGQVDDGRCVLGRGEIVVANVKSGEAIGPVGLVIAAAAGCDPPITDGGLGSDAQSGTGGAVGTGGTGGPGGREGGTGGSGTGGVAGTGGSGAGSGGSGGSGSGGSVGSGGSGTGGAATGGSGTGGRGTGGTGTGGRGTGGTGTGGRGTGGAATGGSGTGGGGGTAGTGPCAGLCANPVTVLVNMNSGSLGTGATCHQVLGVLQGVLCGNFVAPRTFSVNGTVIPCAGGLATPPAARNGGYCMQATAGEYSYAYFSTY